MNYDLALAPLAKQQLTSQPEPLQAFIVASLNRLAQSPSSASRSSAAIARGQSAEFKFEHEGVTIWVTVTFLFGQDEQTLHVELISVEFGG